MTFLEKQRKANWEMPTKLSVAELAITILIAIEHGTIPFFLSVLVCVAVNIILEEVVFEMRQNSKA